MGDFAQDTEVSGGDGRYRARLSPDWEIWGPCGGYLATVALRAAGAHSQFDVPASLYCQFLGGAAFDDVDIETETRRAGRRSESVRATMTQRGRPVCEIQTWIAMEGDGLRHDWTEKPDVAGPAAVPTIQEQWSDYEAWFPFWDNFEYRPLTWIPPDERANVHPCEPRFDAWFRYLPTARFDDPFVDAGRAALLADIIGWPSANRAVPPEEDGRFIAPNVDVSVVFHQPMAATEYLVLHGEAPLATGGFVGGTAQVWSDDGRLLASSVQQMMCRPGPTS